MITAKAIQDMLKDLEAVKGYISARDRKSMAASLDTLRIIESRATSIRLEDQWRSNIIDVVKRYRSDIEKHLAGTS